MSVISKPIITKQDWAIVGCIAAVLVVVAVAVVALVYRPQRDEMRQLDEEIAQVEGELEVARETARRVDELERELEKVKTLVARFEAKLPTRKEIPTLYGKFQSSASEAKVVVEEIEKLDESKNPPRVDIPYDFKVSGSYHELAGFINALETGERFVKISDVHIGEQKGGKSEAEFKVTTYLFTEVTEEGR